MQGWQRLEMQLFVYWLQCFVKNNQVVSFGALKDNRATTSRDEKEMGSMKFDIRMMVLKL